MIDHFVQQQLDKFKGSVVTEINPINPILIFDDSSKSLTIECPWRLTRKNEVIIGIYEYNHEQTKQACIKKFEEHLFRKTIIEFQLNPNTSDIFISFEDNLDLELFHTSSMFEGWQLYGENGFLLISLPGGKLSHSE